MANSKVIEIFIAYSRKDADFLSELKTFLWPLERKQSIKIWYDGEIVPGQVWEDEIKQALHKAEIFLLLVSADSLASDYFYNKEVSNALQRHYKGESIVIPVILKPCGWRETDLATLQALPQNGKPVTLWNNKDEAYESIYEGLKSAIRKIQDKVDLKTNNDEEQNPPKIENREPPTKDVAPPILNSKHEESNRDDDDTLVEDNSKATYRKWFIPILILLILSVSIGIYFITRGTKNERSPGVQVSKMDTAHQESSMGVREKKAEPGNYQMHSIFEFQSFSDAFNFVFGDAKNNFATVRGELLNEELKNYSTKITISDKSVEPSNIFQRNNEWAFRFVAEGAREHEPGTFKEYDNLIQSVLKRHGIGFEIRTVPYGKGDTPLDSYQYRDNTGYTVVFNRGTHDRFFRYEIIIFHSM